MAEISKQNRKPSDDRVSQVDGQTTGQTTEQTSELYQTTKGVPFAEALSLRARQNLYQVFMSSMRPDEKTRILDVGVTCDQQHDESNFLEQYYPHKHRLTCVGVEDGSFLEKKYPGLKFQKIAPHQALPFADHSFDIAYSNAVLEHVGDRQAQDFFVAELCRVGKRVFLAAPNRLFPVEHHTAIPFIHFLPNPIYRRLLKWIGLGFWADEQKLNLFYPWTLAGFFPHGHRPATSFAGVGWGPLKSNVVAHTNLEN